jgi:hypothetical protein
VNKVVQGVPEALGPKWLTDNRFRPSDLVWSAARTLCAGDMVTTSLVEKLLSGAASR